MSQRETQETECMHGRSKYSRKANKGRPATGNQHISPEFLFGRCPLSMRCRMHPHGVLKDACNIKCKPSGILNTSDEVAFSLLELMAVCACFCRKTRKAT